MKDLAVRRPPGPQSGCPGQMDEVASTEMLDFHFVVQISVPSLVRVRNGTLNSPLIVLHSGLPPMSKVVLGVTVVGLAIVIAIAVYVMLI
jgi:hypothetical protein